jgi:6-phosphogluconolactonase (cycloisomerase 2 family)
MLTDCTKNTPVLEEGPDLQNEAGAIPNFGSREGRRKSMKLKRIGQGLLATAASVAIALGTTSCNPSHTIDYVYVTSNTASSGNTGQILSYHVDSQSGVLNPVVGSPFSSDGANPVAEVASPNDQYLYVANHDSNSIAVFGINTDGSLASIKTYSTPGVEPVAVAMNNTGSLLFVVDYYQSGYSDTNPGPGELVTYPVNSDGTLGSPIANGSMAYTPLQCFPGGVAVTPNGSYVYVTNTNSVVVTTSSPTTATPPATPSTCPSQGTISAFSIGSSGTLTAISGSPFSAGSTPTGIAIDPTSRFLYATDSIQNQLIVYDIQTGGSLYPLTNGPFATGTFPVGVVVDPRDEYLYVTNYNSADISEYAISMSNGTPSQLSTPTRAAGAVGPTCISIDPALGRFVYTSDYLGSYIGGSLLNPNTGALAGTQAEPYQVNGKPTCVVTIAHGNHATQIVSSTSGN